MGAHLTMDDNDKDVNVATASERGLAMRTALGNDRIIGGRVGAKDCSGVAPGVHELFDKADAAAFALSPAARLQAYLAMLPNADTFVVLHGLHWNRSCLDVHGLGRSPRLPTRPHRSRHARGARQR
jgi:hypothetical protein